MGNVDVFEAIAGNYDLPERISLAQISAHAIRECIENGREKTALDFGCGTGLVGLELIHDFQRMIFLDAAAKMIERIREKINAADIWNAAALCYDFETAASPDIHADHIFMAQVLLHIPDTELILTRLYQVLNPSGQLTIVDFNKNEQVESDRVHKGFDLEILTALMTKIGYQDIRSRTIYSGRNIFMKQDASLFILDARRCGGDDRDDRGQVPCPGEAL